MTASKPEPETVPFSEWMRRALFDPERGYYARNLRGIGRRGDFTTAASVSDALGEAVAGWLRTELKHAAEVRAVIEVGGGDGSLMRAVRGALGFFARRRLRFFMVENSPVLRGQQKEALKTGALEWFPDLPSALDACHGRAMIFHNELLDAFPVTLAEWDGSTWREVWLSRESGRWTEQLRELSLDLEERRGFSAIRQAAAHAPQRVELGSDARKWILRWAPHWRAGAMLTLDYGDEFPRLYQRKPRGTLRAYLLHQRITGSPVYENMGRQDITADVNFTDVIQWGEECGWQASGLETHSDFLRRHLPDFDRRLHRDPGLRFLADDSGAGTAFRVLVQRAG